MTAVMSAVHVMSPVMSTLPCHNVPIEFFEIEVRFVVPCRTTSRH